MCFDLLAKVKRSQHFCTEIKKIFFLANNGYNDHEIFIHDVIICVGYNPVTMSHFLTPPPLLVHYRQQNWFWVKTDKMSEKLPRFMNNRKKLNSRKLCLLGSLWSAVSLMNSNIIQCATLCVPCRRYLSCNRTYLQQIDNILCIENFVFFFAMLMCLVFCNIDLIILVNWIIDLIDFGPLQPWFHILWSFEVLIW